MQPGNSNEKAHQQGTLPGERVHPAMENSPPLNSTLSGAIAPSRLGRGLSAPEKVGPFRVGHQVSHSARSSVFAGTCLSDGRAVVLKFPEGWGAAADDAAKREFRALKRLQGPGVVHALRLLRCGTRSAIVTDALQRRNFISKVRGTAPVGLLPDLTRLIHTFSSLLKSLHRIHVAGWVHGSIRAEHVLFDSNDDPVWIDFSNAAPCRRPSWCPPGNRLVANSPYLAPELICAAPEKPAADMFAIGRLLAYSLSGAIPRWYPGEAMTASDLRVQSQLPKNTPRSMVDLCARLVRLAPVQRPSAAMAYHALTGQTLEDASTPTSTPSSDSSSRCPWASAVAAKARRSFQRAAEGQGSFHLITIENYQADLLEPIFHSTLYDEPRLILTGTCDAGEQTPIPGFDSLLDLLAVWFEQLAPTLQASWRRKNYPSLRYASDSLGQALGQSNKCPASPSSSQLESAIIDVAKLFADLSQQRTLVLILHQVDQFDAASARLLHQLIKLTHAMPIILVCSTTSTQRVADNQHVKELLQWPEL